MKGANRATKPSAMQEKLKADYKVDVDKALIKNALFDVKRSPSFDNRAFGLVSSFLDVLTRNNEGSTTSVLSLDGIFQRASSARVFVPERLSTRRRSLVSTLATSRRGMAELCWS